MSNKPFSSVAEQVAEVLREGLRQGRWQGNMPGRIKLAAELGVNHKTANAALKILECEGMLVSRGAGREREIVLAEELSTPSSLRIRILLYEENDAHHEIIVQLGFRLKEGGHHVAYADKTLTGLHFDVKRVARMVEKDDADAWVIMAGSRPVLEWFAARPVPAFALFGRQSQLPLASLANLKSPAVAEALRKLVDMGHHRIVLLVREERRKPTPGMSERRFLEELESLGIRTGAYNLPDWDDDRRSFHRCLDSLFRHTPPSALMIGEPALFFATQQHLANKGLAVPRDVSLIALDDHPSFEWFDPEVSHIRTETRRYVPRVVQWAGNVAKGKKDIRETLIRGEFIVGGTIGPVPDSSQP
jgi:DNA-binding LacI/PurR family transcriptional regulator